METSSPCFHRGSWNIYKTDHILGDEKMPHYILQNNLNKSLFLKRHWNKIQAFPNMQPFII